MNIAVILAGGKGNRMQSSIPKQFLKVAGKRVIEHTIEAFELNENVDEIAVVCNPHFIHTMDEIVVKNNFHKLKKILSGGQERYQSSLVAIEAYNDNDCLIFHDAVRPLVSQRIISESIKALTVWDAVDVAIKTTDTIIEINNSDTTKIISSIPNRDILYNGQTPQAFRRTLIKHAYEIALTDPNFKTSDDCGVVRRYLPDTPIFVVDGELENMKITYEEDVFLCDKLFQLKRFDISKYAIEIPHFKFTNKVFVIFGSSYGIGKSIYDKAKSSGGIVYGFSRTNGVDVSDVESIKNALNLVNNNEGRIDYIVNTAGLLQKQPFHLMSIEDIQKGVNTNYLGSLFVAQEGYKYLQKTKGSLLLFTSSSYTRGRMLYAIYSSTKAAIVNLVQALSEEWQDKNIRINCICPERTKTPMRIKNFGFEPDDSLCSPEKVADYSLAVLFSMISGEIVDVRK